ncbi:MAG: TlpA family protein disulfide reductase [Gammaproteobacteria bacterium]|nr:TlpA family protein disulfide reductase [Gammaproteobacteria bacterium]
MIQFSDQVIRIGPLLLATDRLIVFTIAVAALLASEWLARNKHPRFADFGWQVLLVMLLAARAGFVITHFSAYLKQPWTILAFWQGGFSPYWGVAAALLFTLWFWRKHFSALLFANALIVAAFSIWMATFALLPRTPRLPLPDITIEKLSGGETNLQLSSGKPLVINLWATWCAPCLRELPMLLDQQRARPDVEFVFISVGESGKVVTNFLQENYIVIDEVLLDSDFHVSRYYNTLGTPTTLFIGPEGSLRARHTGELSHPVFEGLLTSVFELQQ